jgi:hypothetical protein
MKRGCRWAVSFFDLALGDLNYGNILEQQFFLIRTGKFGSAESIENMVCGDRIWFVNKLVDVLKKEKEEADKARAEMEKKAKSKSTSRPSIGRRRR